MRSLFHILSKSDQQGIRHEKKNLKEKINKIDGSKKKLNIKAQVWNLKKNRKKILQDR
jgi:hypothetical protein